MRFHLQCYGPNVNGNVSILHLLSRFYHWKFCERTGSSSPPVMRFYFSKIEKKRKRKKRRGGRTCDDCGDNRKGLKY